MGPLYPVGEPRGHGQAPRIGSRGTPFNHDCNPRPEWRRVHASTPDLVAISVATVDQLERLRTLSGHGAQVTTLAFSGGGVYIASSSLDRTVKL